ncbi:MAG: hypothetical protein EXS05_10895 [Planctomycetaceae bacterium]|nr:hypothetical protein [Planctomycetaceae bacterium]
MSRELQRPDIVGHRIAGVWQTAWDWGDPDDLYPDDEPKCRVFVSLQNETLFELDFGRTIQVATVDAAELIPAEFREEPMYGPHESLSSVIDSEIVEVIGFKRLQFRLLLSISKILEISSARSEDARHGWWGAVLEDFDPPTDHARYQPFWGMKPLAEARSFWDAGFTT